MNFNSNNNIFGGLIHNNFFPVISGKKNNNNIKINAGGEELFEEVYKKIYSNMKLILNNYISGDIDDELYTKNNLLNISNKIFLLKKTNYKHYNSILELLHNNITSIYRGYIYYLDNKELNNGLKLCKEKVDILENTDKLKEYLEKLQKNIILFETESSLNVAASVKEEYLIYIQRYGFPNDGVFDMELLRGILSEINK